MWHQPSDFRLQTSFWLLRDNNNTAVR
jgi:hypothetical protein